MASVESSVRPLAVEQEVQLDDLALAHRHADD
jgi:hypothetical protein